MKKISKIQGNAIPLSMNDVDTDLIIPAQYLTNTGKTGYGEYLFHRLRINDPHFVFNQKKYSGANILITQENFGCGSSREHAVWALQEGGIDAIIAISFADIFFHNSAKNGLVLIKLSEIEIENLLQQASNNNYVLTIDIERQQINSSHQEIFNFEMDPFRKHCFVHGLDELDYLLNHREEIIRYQMECGYKYFKLRS